MSDISDIGTINIVDVIKKLSDNNSYTFSCIPISTCNYENQIWFAFYCSIFFSSTRTIRYLKNILLINKSLILRFSYILTISNKYEDDFLS